MAETASKMIPLGSKASPFQLFDPCSNKVVSLDELKSDTATVIMFICNHCPYVKHIQTKLVEVANIYQAKGIHFIAINSNDTTIYREDDPEHMIKEAKKYHYPFPYLFDETQDVAKAYSAACTPDFYVFDHEMKCVYRGRFDDATPGNHHPVTGADLSKALDQILSGLPVFQNQKYSLGCNIKWKK